MIKEQQAANLCFSSDQSARIPEDRAQVMLTLVSATSSHSNMFICQTSSRKRSNAQTLNHPHLLQALQMLQMARVLEVQATKL